MLFCVQPTPRGSAALRRRMVASVRALLWISRHGLLVLTPCAIHFAFCCRRRAAALLAERRGADGLPAERAVEH